MTVVNPFPLTQEVTYIEDIDNNILIPAMDAVEAGIEKLGFKVTDEMSDEILEHLDILFDRMFPNTDYKNYN
jgi:hypothetical protein